MRSSSAAVNKCPSGRPTKETRQMVKKLNEIENLNGLGR